MRRSEDEVDPLQPDSHYRDDKTSQHPPPGNTLLNDNGVVADNAAPKYREEDTDDSKDEKSGSIESKSSNNKETGKNKDENKDQEVDKEEEEKTLTPAEARKERWKDRLELARIFCTVYIKCFSIFLGFLSIYWGTMYNRQSRYKNLEFLIVLEDQPFTSTNGTSIPALIENHFVDMALNNATISKLGGWKVANLTSVVLSAISHNITVQAEVQRLVHHNKAWVGVYIQPNATMQIYDALVAGNVSFVNSTVSKLINIYYEEGRHMTTITTYVLKHLTTTQESWMGYYVPKIYQGLLANIGANQKLNLISNSTTIPLLNTGPSLYLSNLSPTVQTLIIGPQQLGLIYAQIFSFHQFNFSVQIHTYLKEKMKFKHFIVYRLLATHINSIFLALVYCLITIAFQVSVDNTFGKSGFLVLWAIMYLYIGASSGINEVVVNFIFTANAPLLIPIWTVFNMIVNMSPTFSALALTPQVYRYGNALPMFVTYNLIKVVFFDTWKGEMGRNFGILIAWIVVTTIIMVNLLILDKKKKDKEEALLEEERKEEDEEMLNKWLEKTKKHDEAMIFN